jgi:hypothetical protein
VQAADDAKQGGGVMLWWMVGVAHGQQLWSAAVGIDRPAQLDEKNSSDALAYGS